MDPDDGSDSLPSTFRNRCAHRQKNDEYLTRKDKNEIEHEIRQHLSKRYDFDDDYVYKLPTVFFSSTPWQEEPLQKLKNDLNSVKSKLNYFDLERWHAHTNVTNYAGYVTATVRKFKPELLTQAWCKFYDILESFPLIPVEASKTGILNTIHLCEAPGAFVASLNHNLTFNYPLLKWEWRANTLNPYYEGNPLQRMINDDRFLMKTSDNWIFGEDFTGNICQRVNVQHLKKTCREIGPIHLVTADGSFDCTDDPAEQEGKVVPLLYCETIAALSILSPGGSFVLKMFTAFECQTICLLYLLRCVFKKMSIYKPTASKEGNSELYIVCLGFIGKESCESLLNELSKRMEDAAAGPVMFKREDINTSFLNEIERCSTFFTGIQISVIQRNIQLFTEGFSYKGKKILNRIKKSIAEIYIANFCIRPLPDDGYLLGKQAFYKRGFHYSPRDETGTFAERQYLKDTDASQLLDFYKTKLNGMHYFWPLENEIVWMEETQLKAEDSSPKIFALRGKPFKTIQSSRFCTSNLLTIFNDVLKTTTPVISFDFWAESATSFFTSSSSSMNCLAYNEFKMVDVRDKPWVSDYHVAQKECLRALCTVLQELEKGSNFVLVGLPLLTQFNVGLVFVLARNFKKIGFPYPRQFGNCIVFQHLVSNDFDELLNVITIKEDEDLALISLVDITALGEEYLKTVTLLNQVLLRKTSLVMAHNL